MKINSEKGITLIALTVMVIILLIISSVMIYSSKNQASIKKIDKLFIDIENISNKVDEYYIKYGELPVSDECTNFKNDIITNLNNVEYCTQINANDVDGKYYTIDLEKIGGISLNYGLHDGEEYVINEVTHQIYFPKGVYSENTVYFSNTKVVEKSEVIVEESGT